MVSGHPDCGERQTRGEVRRVEVSNRQQTNYSGHHQKAPVGRCGGDRACAVQGPGRARDSWTAPVSFAGTPLRGGRTSARAEETAATWLEEIPSRRNWLLNETSTPRDRRQAPGQGGVDPRPVARDRPKQKRCRSEHVRRTCRSPRRRVEDVDHSFGGFGILEGENDSPNPVWNVGIGRGMASARVRNKQPRSERQASSRTAHGIWTKATV